MAPTDRRLWNALPGFALALAAVLVGLGGVRADAPAGERYALLIAVRQYDKNELRDLPYAEDDVTALAEVLQKAGYQRVVVMTQTEGAKQARFLPLAANIRKTLKGVLADRTADDGVLVAFAGHGVQFKGEDESYFCPMDARLDDKQTLISLGDVYKDLEASEAGMRLLVVDACRNDPRSDESRAVSRVKLESVTRPQKALPPGGVAALFSCSAGEKAFESGTLKHGVFFHFLVEGLRGKADLDGDGQVDLDELVRYTKRQVPDFVKGQYGDEVRQMPELVGKTRGLMCLAKVESGGAPDAATTEKPKRPGGAALAVGTHVFGRWAPDGFWYPGEVKEAKGGQYFIHFDDNDTAWLVESNATTYLPSAGDRVQGNWDGKGRYFNAKVTTRQGEKVRLAYDDGNEEDTTVSYLRVSFRDDRPIAPDAAVRTGPFVAGRRVFGRWAADGFWYAGTIKAEKDGKYLIIWEDDTQKWLDPGDLTTYQPRVGDRVEGDWLGKGLYYKGRVTSRRGEKVHILYDDGDEEDTTVGRLRAEYDGATAPGR